MIHRHIRRWTVMLRPVKFDAAGNPRTGKSHQRRFDHMVIIYKIVIICFVICALDSSAKFRQDHNLQIFIFQIYYVPDLVFLFMANFFCGRIRIYFSRTSLIYSFFQKHRIFVRCTDLISWNHYIFFPDFCAVCRFHIFPSFLLFFSCYHFCVNSLFDYLFHNSSLFCCEPILKVHF